MSKKVLVKRNFDRWSYTLEKQGEAYAVKRTSRDFDKTRILAAAVKPETIAKIARQKIKEQQPAIFTDDILIISFWAEVEAAVLA